MKTVYTTCRYCEANCALEVQVRDNKVQRIRADQQNPQTWRDACAKGLTAQQLVEHPRRIRSPMKRVGDRYVEASYEEAIRDISSRLQRIIAQHGPDAIGFYHGNPSGFTAGMMFALGFFSSLGSRSKFSVGSVDQNNHHVVSRALLYHDYVPLNPDIDHCDFLLMVGMNPAESKFAWLGCASNGWERALDRQQQGMRMVVVDPRRTRSADHADMHLVIRPGSDWALLLGMIKTLFAERLLALGKLDWLEHEHVLALAELVEQVDLPVLAEACGIEASCIQQLARDYVAAGRGMCLTQTGVSQNDTGTLGHWLGLALDLLSGYLDRPGGRRFDPGYINMTAFSALNKAQEFSSRVNRQKTVMAYQSLGDLAAEILTPGEGQVRAMIIHAGNPVIAGAGSEAMDQAFASLELLVAVDLVQRESHRHADWLIPGVHWLERGELPFNLAGGMDQPLAQYAQQALTPPPGVMEEWRFFLDLTLAMKRPFMGIKGLNSLVRFSRWLARVCRQPGWELSPDLVTRLLLSGSKKLSWKTLLEHEHGVSYAPRRYGQLAGLLKGRKIPLAPEPFRHELQARIAALQNASVTDDYPFVMISKRSLHMMNSWLMELPNMQRREQENFCELNPQDAAALHIGNDDRLRISSAVGSIELRARLDSRISAGTVCIQHGWGSGVFAPADPDAAVQRFGVNSNVLVDPLLMDPFSGTPNLNSSRVRIETLA